MIIYLIFNIILFTIGICGVFLSRKNILITIMSLEIMLLSINLNLVFFSSYIDDIIGLMVTMLVLSIGASETAIGLALVVLYYKEYKFL